MTIPILNVTMETQPVPKREFMARFERYEPVITDHTAIITAKACLRKYFYRIVLGMDTPESAIYFAWGSAYHSYRHKLELVYGYGPLKPKPFDEAKAKEAFTQAALQGLNYWKKYGKDQAETDKFSWMTAPRLLKSFNVAFEHWKREKQHNIIEVVAVEQPFSIQMEDGTWRGGRADQIIRWNGKLWGRDFKTSSKDGAFYSRTLDPNEQFTGYTWAEAKLSGEQVQGQIIEVLYNNKATKYKENGPTIIELTASRTKYQLDMWEKEHMFYKKFIDQCREEDIWPMQEVSCSFCQFHSVCKQPSEAAMMYQLQSNFKVNPWDHTKVGHDL